MDLIIWKCDVSFWNDWKDIFKPKNCNWIDFSLIAVNGEWTRYNPTAPFEIHLALLGFHIHVGYVRDWEEVVKRKEFRENIRDKE